MITVPRVRVLNPNSIVAVTEAIARAFRAAVSQDQCLFDCATAHDGPPGIVTQSDFEQAARIAAKDVAMNAAAADAFVLACFSDPGVVDARAHCNKPVIGLGEAGMRAAMARGERVGVIAIARVAIPRHLRYWDALGVLNRVAAERPLDLPVHLSGDTAQALEPMIAAARLLVDEDGADVVLLGCAGMADLRKSLESAVGVPVIDPCEAAAVLSSRLARARRDRSTV
jgi:allantoin racemase